MNNTAAYNAYTQNNLQIESPQRLVEMMYEGILRFASLAKRSFENKDIEKQVYWVNRCIAIFSELVGSLDYERGGDVSHYLSGLYTHQIKILSEAIAHDKAENLDETINVVKGLLEAWKEVHQNQNNG
jgi:flagellar protein FliS